MARRETADMYYDKEKVSKCLEDEWQNILLLIEGSLKSYSAGKVSQPVRAAVQIKEHDGLLLAMPAYDSELDSLATKVVTVFPENKKKGLSSVQSVVLLYNAADGKLKAV
ncbi:ketimine reductase mu-crystallin-like, partial [Stegodyphus dumicola]|uniref:ketimine reductase mu-crystallin-like n=1 Tax=Stegodyphus dumicola TaxID=202533 RepID=UPI0015AA10F1